MVIISAVTFQMLLGKGDLFGFQKQVSEQSILPFSMPLCPPLQHRGSETDRLLSKIRLGTPIRNKVEQNLMAKEH